MSGESEKLLAELLLTLKSIESHLKATATNSPFPEGWSEPRSAAAALQNEGVKNVKHLQKLRLDGAFNELKGEIRNVSRGDRPTWEYHVPSCRKALQRYFKRLAS